MSIEHPKYGAEFEDNLVSDIGKGVSVMLHVICWVDIGIYVLTIDSIKF